ncbi:hypothetical protein C8R47DRAFT_1075747 [Mycena vitilis]|nr:hypothetical protein C8R47DRAFT_1075747 [Mycena vitilis]
MHLIGVQTCHNTSSLVVSTRPLIENFLGRHPHISRLIIGGLETPTTDPLTPPSPLPKLKYYVGPTTFIDFFPPGIRQVLILWTAENPAIDAALSKLALLTSDGAQLTFSSLYIRDPTAAIVASLARHLPNVECVQLRSVANQTGRLEPEYIDTVSHQLHRFTQLRYLTLEFLALLDPVRDPAIALEDEGGESYDTDRLTVERWSRNCPTLRECCFHGNAWRLVRDCWTRVAERDLKELGNRKY